MINRGTMIGHHELNFFSSDNLFYDVPEYIFDQEVPAQLPNVDIWKKFELYPTPPSSPQREDTLFYCPSECDLSLPALRDKLCSSPVETIYFPDSPLSFSSDPMWSGHVFDGEIMQMNEQSQKTSPKNMVVRMSTPSVDLGPNVSDCIDPQSVFAYGLDSSSEPVSRNMGTDTPSDSEEEIDVVSVASKQRLHAAHVKRMISSSLLHHALSDVQTTHNYSKPHIQLSPPVKFAHRRPVKLLLTRSNAQVKRLQSDDKSSSPTKKIKHGGGDSPKYDPFEINTTDSRTCLTLNKKHTRDSTSDHYSHPVQPKRSQHNVLERKRRDDLKSSFYTLKDAIPELTNSERAPKVLILQRALDYVFDLKAYHTTLSDELEAQRQLNKQLTRRLHKLQIQKSYKSF